MKTLLIFLITSITLYPIKAQTYLYKRSTIVKQNIIKTSSGDAHYITFVPKGCYESDNHGISENYGFIKYIKDDNSIHCYYGESSFGKANYFFSANYDKINIKTSDNTVYVYIRTNDIKQSLIREKHIDKNNSSKPYTPISPISSSNINIDNETDIDTQQRNNTKSRYGYKTCHLCNGSGKCSICNGRGHTSSYYTGEEMLCSNCNHSGICPKCKGTGKVYGIK